MPIDALIKKRDKLIATAKSFGMDKLWVIKPGLGTFLRYDTLYIVYDCGDEKPYSQDSQDRENSFLDILYKELGGSVEILLFRLFALEQMAVTCPSNKAMICAQLQNLVPFEKLKSDVPLLEQKAVPREPASELVVRQRMQKVIDYYKKEKPVSASELLAPLSTVLSTKSAKSTEKPLSSEQPKQCSLISLRTVY